MLDDNAVNTRSDEDNGSENYRSHDTDLDKNYIVQWTSPEENKYFFKHRYVSASRSVPRRNKQFVRYRINRSLNSDVLNIQNSSSDNSSADGEKYLTRSAKIMRALHFNTSPTYYGRTKIKRSLNFNLTPSPKTFSRTNKNIRRASSLNFATSSPKLSKVLNYDDSPSSSVNSSLVFAASDSIDENQNETPSQQRIKARQSLSYSTPETKFDKKSSNLFNFTPYLRPTLKEKINNIIYVAATPNQSAKYKSRLKYSDDILVGTPRNLLHDFHDEDNSRPTTPENLVRLIPESMSAIKRSHKKERSSRRSERSEKDPVKSAASEANVQDIKVPNEISPISTSFSQINCKQLSSMAKLSKKRENRKYSASIYNSVGEDNLSDTGSLFDYTEEQERILKDELDASDIALPYNAELLQVEKQILGEKNNSINLELEESMTDFKENEPSTKRIAPEEDAEVEMKPMKIEVNDENRWGARTPESIKVFPECSQKPMTPENCINHLQHVLQDSIKKSHKKIKEDRKKKLFSPKVLQYRIETTLQKNPGSMNQLEDEQCKTIIDAFNDSFVENENNSMENTQRACTPEKVSSSRLLLSQFSSVKKSHKKDKHNKILSRFKKRQEYFNRDLELLAEPMKIKNSEDEVIDKESPNESSKEISEEIINLADICFDSEKLSPSKRMKSLDSSLDHNASSISCDSEFQEYDSDKEDFQIFTPLKRKKAGAVPLNVEYFPFYKMPLGGEDISEESLSEANLTRCLTPVVSFRSNSLKSNDSSEQKRNENNKVDTKDNYSVETELSSSNSRNATGGRSTPRNMPTTELYPNIDSIKKSHKKNKRGNRLRRKMGLNENCETFQAKSEESPFRKSENLPLDSSNESVELCLRDDDVSMENACKVKTDVDRNQQNIDKELQSQNVDLPNAEAAPIKTPPNCLKTMNYITRLQNTSIKRSHKKVRDKKKHEITVEVHDLSDEGSIFGDEERLCSLELDKSSSSSKEQFALLSQTETINS